MQNASASERFGLRTRQKCDTSADFYSGTLLKTYGLIMQNEVTDATPEVLVELHLKQSFC